MNWHYPSQCKTQDDIRTSKSFKIIRKAERQLLNKFVRSINNTIELKNIKRDTCINQLAKVFDKVTFNKWQAFIKRVIKAGHKSIMECQSATLNRLWHKTRGGHPKGRSGNGSNTGGYMYTINSGHSNHSPSSSSTLSSIYSTSITYIWTTCILPV